MKKWCLFLFFLINCSGAVYAQSKKKLNVQLTNRLAVEKAKYDSLVTAYNNNLSTLLSARSLAGNTLYKSLGIINYDIEEKRYILNKQIALLTSLDRSDSTVIEVYNEKLTNYYDLKDSLEPLFDFYFTERKAIPPLNLTETSKLADRNSKMSVQIESYKAETDTLKILLAELSDNKAKITSFNATSDDLIMEYSNELNRLMGLGNKFQSSITNARREFTGKGPKGFSAAFFIAFPDVFPGVDPYNPDNKTLEERYDQVQKEWSALSPPPKLELPFDGIYEIVDTPAEYPGGRDSLVAFLSSNIHYPEFAFTNKIGGKCYVKFIVSETGKISHVKVQRGIEDCRECDEEAKRVVEKMPDWKPGSNNGKPVSQWYTIPIVFKVPNQK